MTCTATDRFGARADGSFVMTVNDSIAPAIAPHGDVQAEASSSSGATVTYAPPATHDAVDGDGVATCSPAAGAVFALGSTTVTCTATDTHGNSRSATFTVIVRRSLTAVGPATVWVGLKNSDDVGLRLDLRAEMLVNGVVAASGDINNVSSGSSGFNNAILQSVAMSLVSGSVDVPGGAQLAVRVSARRTCFGTGHASGTAREWFDGLPVDSGTGRDAGSRVRITLGGTTSDYFLRSAFGLATLAGSARQSVDVVVNSGAACPARPFVPFGVWSTNLP